VITFLKPKSIGSVSCDSGQVTLVDPSHLTISETGQVCLPSRGLCTSVDTEIGDGEFTVYEQRDRKGRLRRIVIELE
jgi:hypothetical protein